MNTLVRQAFAEEVHPCRFELELHRLSHGKEFLEYDFGSLVSFQEKIEIMRFFSPSLESSAPLSHPNHATVKPLNSGTLLLLIFIAFTLISCTRTEESSDTTSLAIGNHLRLDIPVPIASLDPTKEESGSAYVFHFLYDSLFNMNEHGELIPELATAFDYDPHKFTWTIYLKEGPRFHNGNAVKASDVVYSLHERLRILRPEYYASIEEILPLSEKSVRIVLNKDDPKFLLKIFATEVVPEAASGPEDYYSHPIGSGPFIFESRRGEKEVGLVANMNYHQGRPSLDRITLYFEPDNEKSWARLINGSTDAAFGIHPVDYDMLAEHQDLFYFNAKDNPLYNTILLYNTYDPLFQNPNLREALSLAIDKEAIVKEVLQGYGKVAAGPLEPDSPYHDPKLEPVPYNPEEGIRLLMQEGWTYRENGKYLHKHGTPLEFTILYIEKNPMMKQVAEHLQLNLNDIGIRAHLIPLPVDELVHRYVRNTEFQAVLTEMHPGFESPERQRHLWSPIESNKSAAGCFEHSDLTRILAEAATETRPERARELYRNAEALIMALQPGTFLFHRTSLDVMSLRIYFPFPFSSWSWDIHRLRDASVKNLKTVAK